VDGVEAQQVRGGRRVAVQLVDVDELEVLALPGGAQREAAHAAEAVDGDAGGGHRLRKRQDDGAG